MKLPSFFQLKKSSKKIAAGGLVPRADLVWKSSIIFLVFLLVCVLFFDGYIFFFRVSPLEQEIVDIGDAQGQVPDVQRSLLERARAIGERRRSTFSGTASSTPPTNPFAVPVAPSQ